MNRTFEEAAELFQQLQENRGAEGDGNERSGLYRGLNLLAKGLQRLEKRLEAVEAELQDRPRAGRPGFRPLRARIRARWVVAPPVAER